MIVKLIIEYDGTGYVGWQKQKNGKSIQGEIENSLNKIFDKNIKLFVAGRTGAGVHALFSASSRRRPDGHRGAGG